MGYVFNYEDARHLHEWFQTEPGRSALLVQKNLLHRLWSPATTQRVLAVGCGAGVFLQWFAQQGHQVTGIDPSPHALYHAERQLPGRVSLDRGFAEHLPYEDNAFDTVALITALEFVDDPAEAIQEALRVARRHVLLGVLNKYSLITWQHCLERLWKPSIYSHARFFSILELRHMAQKALTGPIPLTWRTCLCLPLGTLRYLHFLENSGYFHRHPFGHFIAMRIDLRYPFQTLQDPLFAEMGSRIGRARMHASCWRSPREKTLHSGPLQRKILGEEARSLNRQIGVSSSS